MARIPPRCKIEVEKGFPDGFICDHCKTIETAGIAQNTLFTLSWKSNK